MATAEELGMNLFDPRTIARPHASYERMRNEAPIAWSEVAGSWVLTRYDDVRSVLRDSGEKWSAMRRAPTSGRPGAHREEVAPPGTLTMLGADPPDHTRLRRLLDRDFTPGKIAALAPHVQEITSSLLAGAAARPTFDVAEELAVPLPVTVIAELLGIPPEMGPQFKRWSDAATEPFRPDQSDEEIAARNREIVEFREYLVERIEERRTNPTDDFIGRLVQAHAEEEKLTDNELLAAVNLLLLAGNETTTNLISNAVLALATFPERQQELRDNLELIDDAIEEFLRYDGSVQFTSRRAVQPAEFYGQAIEPDQNVMLVIASANRDAAVFERPNELDFHRGKVRHLGFGDWIHVCIGQYLARVETRSALLTLLREFPKFELAIDPDSIPYRANFNLRGPKHLPIRLVD